MTSDLDKISRKENKHIRALQCSDASRLGSHKMQRKASLVSRGMEAGQQAEQPPLSPAWACVPFGLEGACRPSEQPNPQAAPLALLQSEKSDTI